MARHGKKYRAAAEKVNVDKEYSLLDAMKLV
jgi:ribosomal protein L1